MDMPKMLRVLLAAVFFLGGGWACSSRETVEDKPDYFEFQKAVLTTDKGEIVIRVDKQAAPETSRNFLNLCGTGFYEGVYFHRVVPGLLVQGGDPNTRDADLSNDGTGGYSYLGPGTFLPDEESPLPHRKGAVSMVRGKNPDSAGSQFFVLLDEVPEYDGEYTVFGQVERGLDILVEAAEQPGIPREEGGFQPEDPLVITGCSVR